jgi:hypothetical protein
LPGPLRAREGSWSVFRRGSLPPSDEASDGRRKGIVVAFSTRRGGRRNRRTRSGRCFRQRTSTV